MKRTTALIAILAAAAAIHAEGLFNLPYDPAERRTELTDRAWPEKYGEAALCIWKDDRLAPFSITIDDNCAGDHPWWRQMGEKYGFKATWFLCSTGVMTEDGPGFCGNWKLWREHFAAGHDIQSHTVTHRDPKIDMPVERDYADSIDHIQAAVPGTRVLAMAYPGGGLANDAALAEKHFIATRGTVGGSNPVHNTNYNDTKVGFDFTPGWNYGPDSLNPEAGAAFRAWRILLYHILHTAPGRRHFEQFIQYFLQSGHDYWIAPFTDVAKYGQARDTATLRVTRSAPAEIAFDLTSKMDTRIYDHPLSVKVRLDPSWNKLTATQAGQPVESSLLKHGGNIYALVAAVPGRGETVLTKQGPEKKFSSNANLAALEYCLNLPVENEDPANYMPKRTSVPNFHPDTLEYRVTLPPGAPRPTLYATPADPAAYSQRTPHLGYVQPTAAEPQTIAVAVTAEDETVKTYTVHFAVEPYSDIAKLAIDTPENLKQETIEQYVHFTATAEPAGRIDITTVEWFVNDEKQEEATGATFRYIPRRYGTHTVQARAAKAQSEKRDILYTKGAPKPETLILAENFSRHATGQPVPTSDDPADNKFSDPATVTNIREEWRPAGNAIKTAEVEGLGRAATWTTADNKSYAALAKRYSNSGTEPIAIAFKVRIDNDGTTTTRIPFQMYMNGGHSPAHHPVWAAFEGGSLINFMPGWDPASKKWISVAVAIDPTQNLDRDQKIHAASYIGNELYLGARWAEGEKGPFEFMTTHARAARDWYREGGPMNTIFVFGGGPSDPANYGKYTTYLADVRIYRPGSLVMTPAKPAYAAGEPVRMNFTHHINLNTLQPDRVKVTDSRGAPVAVETLATDPMNFDHFTMTFANGVLKKGETYKVELDETVRDVVDKTAYDAATFKIQ